LTLNLELPINYQAFGLVKTGAEIEFNRLYDGGTKEWKELPSPYPGKSNPLREDTNA